MSITIQTVTQYEVNAMESERISACGLALNGLFGTALLSGIGSATAAIGAAIGEHQYPEEFDALTAARAGAIGGAVLALPQLLIGSALLSLVSMSEGLSANCCLALVGLGVQLMLAAATAVTGEAILNSQADAELMSLENAAKASVTGSLVLTACALGAVAVGAGCVAGSSCGKS